MAVMTIAAVLGLLGAAGGGPGEPAFHAPQVTSDYAAAMRRVATRFAGTPGVYLQIGDSLTYASPNTAWARDGLDHTPAEAGVPFPLFRRSIITSGRRLTGRVQ